MGAFLGRCLHIDQVTPPVFDIPKTSNVEARSAPATCKVSLQLDQPMLHGAALTDCTEKCNADCCYRSSIQLLKTYGTLLRKRG